ncbi:uncharacterized protein LOC141903795 [Tubulanus polymorphus]|uniref:uncharacterized protein LOC141903795 n=1 Tax=Tubulanus polymorphus TaxID=672921 RepID=UPI003DA27839
MARRKLESAIQLGRALEKDYDLKEKFKNAKVNSIPHDISREGIFSLQFSYDANHLAVGHGTAGVLLYDAVTGKYLGEPIRARYGGLAIMCVRFNPKEQSVLFASSSEGKIYKADINTMKYHQIIEEEGNEINCMDFCMDGFNFATGGRDLGVRVYDTNTAQLVRLYEGYSETCVPTDYPTAGHAMRVFALKYHPERNDIFVTAGWDNCIKIWDARSQDGVKRSIGGAHVCGDSLDIRGNQILTGSWTANHALQIWDYTEGKLAKEVPFPDEGNGSFLYCAQYFSDSVVIAGGSGTNSAKIININTDECYGVIQMKKPVQAMDSTLGGGRIAVGSGDDSLKLINLP